MRYAKLLFFTVSTLLILPCGKANAADPVTSQFTVTPAIFERVLTPGQSTTEVFQLSNKSQLPLPIKSYVRAFEASDDQGGVDIVEDKDIERLAPTSWVNVETPDFIIQPDSIYRATVNFNPPVDLPPGGYYAVIFFEPQLPESYIKSQNTLQINGRVGALLFLVGSGDISEKAEINTFKTKKWHWGNQPINIDSSFKNLGNVHLRPSGQLKVKNLIPFLKQEQSSEVKEVTVLPNKTRALNLAETNLKWPGIYKAGIEMKYGRDEKVLSRDLTFIFIPWKYILSIILLILFIIFISKRRNRRRLKKALAVIDGEKKI